jgi:carbon monoxide dehydrogenase subunit G
MQLEHNFTVAAPLDRAWEVLLDLERMVPCMPGATLTSYEGDEFTGTVRVKLGPVVMTFAGRGRFVERDAQAHRMVIEASGRDTKGAGTASAKINATLRPDGDATGVAVLTDLTITGRVAQLGRGMIADVSARLLDQFTACLAEQLAPPPSGIEPAPDASSVPTQTAAPAVGPGAAAVRTAPAQVQVPAQVQAPAPAAAPQPAAVPGSRAPAEPIDLLGVTGARAAARRVGPYVLVFLLGAMVGAVLGVWLS